jgi:hypothetical protein
MNSDAAVGHTLAQSSTFLIRVDGFSPARRREQCRVTFLDHETSSVIATCLFDSGFVGQASLREMMNVMGVGYRYRSHCVEQSTRAVHLATRNVSRALAAAGSAQRSGHPRAGRGRRASGVSRPAY